MLTCLLLLLLLLQGASDISVAGPIQAAAIQPLIVKFTLLKTALEGLEALLTGPQGALIGAVDGALSAATGAAGAVGAVGAVADVVTGAPGGVAINTLTGLIDHALGLMGPFVQGLTGLLG